MTIACDYATVFELEIRPRRGLARRAAALAVWTALFIVRPGLALRIWKESRA